MKTARNLLLFILLFSQMTTLGQIKEGFFRNLGVLQGLPSEYTVSTIQDSEGYIWVGSTNGLSRYDGYSFTNYESKFDDNSSIAGDFIFCMEKEAQGKIWIGYYEAGLDLFNTKTGKVELHFDEQSKLNAIPDNRITKLWNEPAKERLWIGTSKEYFAWFDKKSQKISIPKFIKHPDQVGEIPERNSIYDFKINPKNPDEYWMATNDGLALYNEKTSYLRYFNATSNNKGYTSSNRLRTLEIIGNKIWLCSRGGSGLMSFDLENHTWDYFPFSPKEENLITKIIQKSPTYLWLATIGKGLLGFNLETRKFTVLGEADGKPSSLRSNDIFDLFEDQENNIWICTNKGLALYASENQLFPLYDASLADDSFHSILAIGDDEKNIYLGYSNIDGLMVVNKKSKTHFIAKILHSKNINILRFAHRPNGEIWMATSDGVYSYKPGSKVITKEKIKLNEIVDERIHALQFVDENTLLIGSRYEGLFLCDLKSRNSQNLTKENFGLVHNRFIHEIIKDKEGHFWIGTERGLSVIDFEKKKVLKNFGLEEGYKVVYRITEDNNHTIWATSESQGVFGFDTKTLTPTKRITKKDGLPSNAIQHVAADDKGSLWISTQQGLCKYNLTDLTIQIFNTQNGLQENHLEGSLNSLSDGQIAIGYKNQFTLFDPKIFKKSSQFIKPVITSFQVFDQLKQVDKKGNIKLNPDENFFTVSFSALNYASADRIEYQYTLKGIDNDWINAKNKLEANYTNLAPGIYEFRVRSSFKGTKGWSEYQSIHIEILPTFWQTKLFYLLLILSGGLIINAFYNQKLAQVKNEERLKTEMNKELMTLELKALRSQMNPHFIFNSLNSIKYYVIQNDTKNASKYLNQFSKLIRRIFNNTQQEFTLLEEEIETMSLFLEMEKLRFGDQLSYEIKVDPALELPFIKIPNMLVQPHIENAIWHGIMHKENKGMILVSFSQLSEDELEIIIEDDGIGREASALLKSKTANDHKSKGIALTQKRIELINENHQMDISTKIIDLKNEDGSSKGTRVCTKMKIIYV